MSGALGRLLLLSLAAGALITTPSSAAHAAHVNLVIIAGSINPASANYLIQAISQSETEGAAALLIELDTPGGLAISTKDIIQAMLNAKVPVIVFVSPRGAWASSAGTYITVAAHVAAMAPGTTIGAATPVSVTGGGGEKGGSEDEAAPKDAAARKAENFFAAFMESIAKQRNRNVEWAVKAVREAVAIAEDEALEIGVIDLIAENRGELLKAIEGREVEVNGKAWTLAVVDSVVTPLKMTVLQRLFDFLADPNVAVVLFLAGLLGLYVEVNNPGLIVPGVVGAVCMVLTAIAFQILPFDWVGLILVLAGVGFLIAEIFVTSFGALFASGIACFLLGGTMLFDRPDLSDLQVSFWSVLVPAVLAVAVFGGLIVLAIGRTFSLRETAGVGELMGLVGQCTTALDPEGKVFVRGEYWQAVVDGEPAAEGDRVEVMAVEGMRLRVRRAAPVG